MNNRIFMMLCFLPLVAEAEIVTWEFSTTIETVSSELADQFSVGDTISGRFSFDTDTVDTRPDRPDLANYDGAVTALTYQISDYSASASGLNISVTNNSGGGGGSDGWSLSESGLAVFDGPDIAGADSGRIFSPAGFLIQFSAGIGMFDSIEMPVSPDQLSDSPTFTRLSVGWNTQTSPTTSFRVSVMAMDFQLNLYTDADDDSINDLVDNCLLDANPDQRDTDFDGIGNRCDPDLNQDCMVNFTDLGIMKAFFFSSGDFDTDLDGDGATSFSDLGIMKSKFFLPPGPGAIPNGCEP